MRAAQINSYGDPSIVTINDIPAPAPSENQVLVEVKASSLNPFDTTIRTGAMKDAIPLTFPVTLGGDIAGVVTELGSNVTELSVGDKVYGQANAVAGNSGAFAEFAATDAAQLAHMPDTLSFEEAATLPLVGVSALQALGEHLNLQAGQKIFIHGGAGGIGSVAIQLAKHIGAHIATTAKADDDSYVRALGADEVIDYTTTDFTEVLHDYDAVFDTVGRDDFAKALHVLKPGGVAVSMIAQPDAELASRLGVQALMQQTHVNTERLAKLTELTGSGVIKPRVGQIFDLDEIVAAFTARENGQTSGKIVLRINA